MADSINTILAWVANEIATNAALKAKLLSYYGRVFMSYVNVDDDLLPEVAQCPLLMLTGSDGPLTDGAQVESLDGQVCIVVEESKEPYEVYPSVWTFRGADRVNEIKRDIRSIILNMRPPGNKFSIAPSTGPTSVNAPPIFKAWIGLAIQQDAEITIA